MASIPARMRQQVVERANDRCEYCQAPLAIVIEMEIDHIIPESAGEPTTLDNLCVACVSCNGFKLAFQQAEDPISGEMVPLFNSRRQNWGEHFVWSANDSHLSGLTATGRATTVRLNMNRERAVAARKLLVAAGWHPPKLSILTSPP
ncbi:HNH endonuclease [Chloroflexota bacterium]